MKNTCKMEEELRQCAENENISDIGFVPAEIYEDLCRSLRGKEPAVFVDPSPEVRSDPFLVMPEVKTIVAVFVSYYQNVPKSRISRYARGLDYHLVLPELLQPLCKMLQEQGYRAETYADSWNLDERYLAWRAGLGFIGENHMLIHPQFGSFGFLGFILTDCEIPASRPVLQNTCENCGACKKACPGGALARNGFCQKKCVSYLTQKKGKLTPEEEKAIQKSGMLWGCDRCQEVCPHNRNIPESRIAAFSENLINEPELNLSNRAFRQIYQRYAFAWRGIAPILRNAEILERNKG